MSLDPKSTYYDAGGIETIDIIKAKLTPEQFKGYLLGNSLKYSCRMMHKTPDNPVRDAEKAAMYASILKEEFKDAEHKLNWSDAFNAVSSKMAEALLSLLNK
ncbi:DUF3310 domain-containing protein [Methylocucumis oryzae]|uniref:DUF3310 domain-containing protein n=1 Tax=Methylocucumis oryzae TaxID=1632867 RepID=UPI0009E522D7|nr:DUF3310 domain-containing protein [Methylocucumis oryzae]